MPGAARLAEKARLEDMKTDLGALLAATASGDRQAFKQLYDLTSGKLFGIALLLLRRRDAAQDALQEAYLRIWSHAGKYDPLKGAPLPWLARIIRNVTLDRIAQDRNQHEDIDDHLDAVAVAPVPVLENSGLARCLATLSGQQRQALLLTYMQGYSNEEVADHLRVPVGTVKSWVHRGSERLKSCMQS